MATGDLGVKYIRGYVFPFWGIFRLGWVTVKGPAEPECYYHDDAPTLTMYRTDFLKYVTVGFTERGVVRRMKKYVESIV